MINVNDTVLFIIDVQERLVGMLKNSDEIIKNNIILSKSAKILNVPSIITEQYPKGLGSTISEVSENILRDNVFEKTAFSALENPEVKAKLEGINPKNVILTGIEAHICVYQTALALISEGYDVYVVRNAVASRNKKDYKTSLELMRDFGVKLTSVEGVLFELLRTSKHVNFKEIQSFIK